MKKILSVLVALALVLSLGLIASADFGDFAGGDDFSFDYDTDWGDSSFDSWGSDDYSDWGSSSYNNWGGGYGDTVYYSGGGGGSLFGGAAIVVIIVIAVIVLANMRKNQATTSTPVNLGRAPDQDLENHIDELKANDPAFSEERFLEDVANLYVRLQNAWSERDLASVQTRISSELYAKSQAQLDAMKQKGLTNHIENISVLGTNVLGCSVGEKEESITVKLMTRITDYTVNDATGEVVGGARDKQAFMTYHWTLVRTAGVKTGEAGSMDKSNCPNCGAPVDLNQHAVCPYCGSVLESGKHDWIVTNIKGISKITR